MQVAHRAVFFCALSWRAGKGNGVDRNAPTTTAKTATWGYGTAETFSAESGWPTARIPLNLDGRVDLIHLPANAAHEAEAECSIDRRIMCPDQNGVPGDSPADCLTADQFLEEYADKKAVVVLFFSLHIVPLF